MYHISTNKFDSEYRKLTCEKINRNSLFLEIQSHSPITPSCCGVKEVVGSCDKFFRKSDLPNSEAEETPDRTDPWRLIDRILGLRGLDDRSTKDLET